MYVCGYICMDLFATVKNLQVSIIHIKIDTIQHNISINAKNVKGKHPNYSGRDSIKGSS